MDGWTETDRDRQIVGSQSENQGLKRKRVCVCGRDSQIPLFLDRNVIIEV